MPARVARSSGSSAADRWRGTGVRMLILQALDTAGAPLADDLVAIDTVGAGAGERVLVLDEGTGARQIVGSRDAPVRSVIVGIVDDVTVPARHS